MPVRSIAVASVFISIAVGCGRDGPETAPNLPTDEPTNSDTIQPAIGPWFVDRAADDKLDVVTICGNPAKRSVLDSLGVGVALFDADSDGDLDIFVAGGTAVRDGSIRPAGGPWLFRNDGPGRWTDVSERSGLRWTGWAQGVAVCDYDGDGDLDLFVCNHGPDTLWQNQGNGVFRDVTASAGIVENEWGVSATWGDYDGDGRPDLYVANYLEIDAMKPPPMIEYLPGVPVFAGPSALRGQPDRLWRNLGDGRFEDATRASGLFNPSGKGMSALFVDLDDDGRPDLYVTNDTQPNELFWNLGNGRFRDGAIEAGVAVDAFGNPEGSMAVDVADLDGDGKLDLAHSNFRREGTRVYANSGNRTFRQISNDTRINMLTQQYVGWGLVLADFDADGRPDFFQANGHVYPSIPDARYDQPPVVLRNDGPAGFEPVTRTWGPRLDAMRSGRAVAVGDLDRDGDLDLVMTTIDGPLRVLIDEGRRTNRAAVVRLVGRSPDTEALGAKVAIEVGTHRQIGIVRRGGSILAASDSALHFGLGGADRIDRLSVRWPDGSNSTYTELPADTEIVIRRTDGSIRTTPFNRTESPPPGRLRP